MQRRRGIGLLSKVIVSMGLVGVLFAVFGTVAIRRLEHLAQSTTTVNRQGVLALEDLHLAQTGALEGRRLVLRHAVSRTEEQMKKIETEMAATDQSILTAIGAFMASDAPAQEKDGARTAEGSWQIYAAQRDREVIPLSRANADADRVLAAIDANKVNADTAVEALVAAGEHSQENSAALVANANETYRSARRLLLSMLAAGFVLLIGVAVLVVRSVQRAADQVRGVATRLSTSANSLDATSTKLASAAEETAAQSQTVATGAEEVGASVRSVAVAAEELAASVHQIAGSTSRAATVADETSRLATASSALVGQLSESSSQISRVLDMISDIAAQTNLLALNATIEAARAGAAGRGFAVVADEVKELATAAAEASGEIASRVRSIQSDAHGAIDAIDRIATVISEVNQLQADISSAVEEQSATTNEIGRSITEAATATRDIAENVSAVAQTARTSTLDAQATHGAARELSELADELAVHVGQFRF